MNKKTLSLLESHLVKTVRSVDYNYNFYKHNGMFLRWGKTRKDDPEYCVYGNEILDMEISTATSLLPNQYKDRVFTVDQGCSGVGCKQFCYKGNTAKQTINMKIEVFRQIMDTLISQVHINTSDHKYVFNNGDPIVVKRYIQGYLCEDIINCVYAKKFGITQICVNGKFYDVVKVNNISLCNQIAFGICSVDGHPQMFDIFKETKQRGIISNVTINGIGITDDIAAKLAKHCGAVAVSINPHNTEDAYDAIKKLSIDRGMDQVNAHVILAEETVPFIIKLTKDRKTDSRLKNLNAIVMLAFKDKRRTGCFSQIKYSTYEKLLQHFEHNNITYGFDSCGAHLYNKYLSTQIGDDINFKKTCCEPCESGLFSLYINVFGEAYPCSFYEGLSDENWDGSIDVLKYKSIQDVWRHEKMINWRQKLLDNNRHCPYYSIGANYYV